MSVRNVMAAIMLVCFGMLIPTLATPRRVCMLEMPVFGAEAHSDAGCCSDCTRKTDGGESCCLDLEALPDVPVPQLSISLPPAIVIDLPVGVLAPPPWIELGHGVLALTESIRGPAPPAARRAVLGVWRL